MRSRSWIEGRVRAGHLLGIGITALALGACEADSKPSSHETTKPKVEPDPSVGATLPSGPSVSMNAAANDAERSFPLDATPSPDGKRVYYTALATNADGDRVTGLFEVSADGGSVEELASGDPLAAPVGITVALDGTAIYVADPGASGGGAILTVPSAGGTPSPVAGTAGYRPEGLTIAKVKRDTSLYFTGTDPASGEPGLFSVSLSGGDVTAIATGSPFGEPGGVTVLSNGDAFVADALAASGFSSVIKVSGGKATPFAERIGVGFPAGITSTRDESKLVISGLDPATRTDLVYFADAKSGELSTLTDTIGAFHDPAGLHRAHAADVFAWADSRANDTGTVYVLRP